MSVRLLVHAVAAPVIANPAWAEIVEPEMVQRARIERLVKVIRQDLEETATDYEAMIYLHTQSHFAPFTGTWTRVYFWVFWQFYPQEAEKFLPRVELNDFERRELNSLKTWIYRKQVEALKERRKTRPAVVGQTTLFKFYWRFRCQSFNRACGSHERRP